MKHRASRAFITGLSIAVIYTAVKARAADSPVLRQSQKSDLKDSVRDAGQRSEIEQLVSFLAKNGHDITIGEDFASAIGLPGARPAKSQNVRNKVHGKDRDALNCAVIYEDSPDTTEGKKPACVYLMKKSVSGNDDDSLYFRIGLDGQLEKVILSQSKNDEEGRPVPGSGQATEKDINSSAIRKTYAAEMKAVKVWLNEQQRLLAKKAKTEPVKVSASASSSSPGKEAAAASTAQ